jgi:hypothetical protein
MPIPESARLFMSGLIERGRKLKKTIAFPEGNDPRVLEAAARLAREGLVKPVLVGKAGAAIDGVTFVDPATSPSHLEIRRSLLRAAPPRASRRWRPRWRASRSTSPR